MNYIKTLDIYFILLYVYNIFLKYIYIFFLVYIPINNISFTYAYAYAVILLIIFNVVKSNNSRVFLPEKLKYTNEFYLTHEKR